MQFPTHASKPYNANQTCISPYKDFPSDSGGNFGRVSPVLGAVET